jgi:crotonobetainyl-CoA:carnitine CoA-transferase CaiB-like acyl-CoA transferase
MPGPLDGYRILDLTAMITGPLATMVLADQGAEVVKLEPPGGGDVMRYLSTMRGGMSTLFAACNRSKRSIVVNLREEAGRELARELAGRADGFVQNFRPGESERLGLAEPVLRARHPGLVYVSLTAFGADGPYAHRPAYDHILQALTGAPYLQGAESGGRPEYVRMAWCDKVTALVAAQAITAALLARERGRGGQHLRLSMLDAALAFLWPDGYSNHALLESDGVVELPPLAHTYRALELRDGFVALAVVTDAQWEGVLRATGLGALRGDPRFASAGARLAHLA